LARGINANLLRRWVHDAKVAPVSALSNRAGMRAAAVMNLVHSARIDGHDTYAYPKDVLGRLPTHPASSIDDLLPRRWTPPKTAN